MNNEVILVQKKKIEEMSDEEITIARYRSLERRYNSLIDAVKLLEDQNNVFRNEVALSYQKLSNAQKNVDINKEIVVNIVTASNKAKDSYLGEIAELKSKLGRM